MLLCYEGRTTTQNIFLEGGLVRGTVVVSQSLEQCDDKIQLWHQRLGHISDKGMLIQSKQTMFGGEVNGKVKLCEACVKGNQHM